MGHNCCVVNCNNRSENSKRFFYKFPASKFKENQKKQWIAAVKRVNGSKWMPRPNDFICSEHFIGNKKSENQLRPSYFATVFSNNCRNKTRENNAIKRHERFLKRRMVKHPEEINVSKACFEDSIQLEHIDSLLKDQFHATENISEKKNVDQACQVEILDLSDIGHTNSFICNRYIFNNKNCDAEIQTDLISNSSSVIVNTFKSARKVLKHQAVGTPKKTYCDKSVSVDLNEEKTTFCGYESIENERQLKHVAGVTKQNFEFLLTRCEGVTIENKCKISLKDRLCILLILLKTGLSFASLSVFFKVHETSISRIFYSMLHYLSATTANLVFWPDKDVIQTTMPECFKPDFINTRVIIDCTEFRIEVPNSVDNRVLTYSHYKKGFTAKVLIGIAPSGFITFKSKVAGGRKSDANMTIESKFIDLLEDGDEVMADKGFPEIKSKIDGAGKKVLLIIPPFLKKKGEFSQEETSNTYNIARLRIHVERVMQRLRLYKILQMIPEHLFSSIDDLLHRCCVMVNLQPPIIAGIEIN